MKFLNKVKIEAAEKSNFDKFMEVYEEGLKDAVTKKPTEYAYGLDKVPDVLKRMKEAIERGSYNHDGHAFKYAAKKLGIKHTRKAIEEFLGLRQVKAFAKKVETEITAKSVGKTSSGKDIPAHDDARMEKLFKLPKYNRNVNVFTAHGNDPGKLLIYHLNHDGWDKKDYLDAASAYEKEAKKMDDEWGKLVRKAHNEIYPGSEYKITDYKVSGVGRDEYPEKYKNDLRRLSHGASAYRSLKHAMNDAAKKVKRVKNMRAPVGAAAVPKSGTPESHQHKIAVDTLKNPSKALLGGPSVEEAEKTLRTKFKYTDAEIKKLKS